MVLHTNSPRTANVHRPAFTLLEILIVVTIIVMMAGAGVYFLLPQLEGAKVNKAKADCAGLSQKVQQFYVDHDRWPTGIQELTVAVDEKAALVPAEGILDPWGQPYQFRMEKEQLADRVVVFTTKDGKEISNLKTPK